MDGGDLLEADAGAAAPLPEPVAGGAGSEGYLLMRNDFGMWSRRWFSLQGRQFCWFARMPKRHTTGKEALPDGFIDLAFVRDMSPLRSHEGAWTISTDEESYTLMAVSSSDMFEWLTRLHLVIDALDHERVRLSQPTADAKEVHFSTLCKKEGWLFVLVRGSWVRQWVVMKGGMLFVYTEPSSKSIKAKHALYHCRLSEYEPERHQYAFHAVTQQPDGKESAIVLKAVSEEEFHRWLNELVKQKVAIEEFMDAITVNV
jgi:hypothetical protein